MSWEQPISVHETGEVGRVYYLNTKLTLIDGEEWTRTTEFTLNPDYGSTVEEMLKRTNEIPNQMKDQLLRKRFSENKLTSGLVYKVWISDYPAPRYWAPTQREIEQRKKAQGKAVLYNANGSVLV